MNDLINVRLGDLFTVYGDNPQLIDWQNMLVEVPLDAGLMVPMLDADHVFEFKDIELAMAWLSGLDRNLYLYGPTGCGKSSLVEQTCARLAIECWSVACHPRLEVDDLVGRFVLKQGEMVWIDGPLVAAARAGGVLLLDEGDTLPPSTAIGLNPALDGRPILIEKTGELIFPQPGFRVCIAANTAGNGVGRDTYRSTQVQNQAFLDRFMSGQCSYLPADIEALLLSKKCADVFTKRPGLIDSYLSVANAVRQQFIAGEIGVTLSTRTLLRWVRGTDHFGGDVLRALDMALLARAKPEDRVAVNEFVTRIDWTQGAPASAPF